MSSGGSEKASSKEKALNLEGFVDERSLVCSPVFVDGYSAGWYFVIPEAFRDALDIRPTPRVHGKRQFQVITQGRNYAFKEGDVLYDTRKAYDVAWGEALKHIGCSVQIDSATAATTVVSKTYRTEGPVRYLEGGKEKSAEGVITYRRTRISYGSVKFTLYRPNVARTALERDRTFETDQERFVLFLQTGILRNRDNSTFSVREFAAGG